MVSIVTHRSSYCFDSIDDVLPLDDKQQPRSWNAASRIDHRYVDRLPFP